MKSKIKYLVAAIILVISCLVAPILGNSNVYADDDVNEKDSGTANAEDIAGKYALYQAIDLIADSPETYLNTAVPITSDEIRNAYNSGDLDSILFSDKMFGTDAQTDGQIELLFKNIPGLHDKYYGQSTRDGDLSVYEAIKGYDGPGGTFYPAAEDVKLSDISDANLNSYMEAFGYHVSPSDQDYMTVKINGTVNGMEKQSFSFPVTYYTDDITGERNFRVEDWAFEKYGVKDINSVNSPGLHYDESSLFWLYCSGSSPESCISVGRLDEIHTEDQLISIFSDDENGITGATLEKNTEKNFTYTFDPSFNKEQRLKKLSEYLMDKDTSAMKDWTETLNENEKHLLYTDLLTNYYGYKKVENKPCSSTKPTSNDTNYLIMPTWDGEGKIEYCYFNKEGDAKDPFAKGLEEDTLIKLVGALDPGKIEETKDESTGAHSRENHINADAMAAGTFNDKQCNAMAESLSWIICPATKALYTVANNIFDFVEPMLMVNSGIVEQLRSGGSLIVAWAYFRDIANIVFVIILLLVILSQVTGIGISNYGIKKMLPRLIIGAVIANLSFIFCAICVDLSNIVGSNLPEFFNSVANAVVSNVHGSAQSINHVADNIGAIMAGVGLVGGTAAGVFAIASGAWMLLLVPILLMFISVVIAALFLLIILGVRQAAVIIIIIISPIAFVMYLLPNSQGLLKKWFKLFEGLLLVYPICGLLIGAGNFASAVLSSNAVAVADEAGFFMNIVAILIQVVPYFLIPSILFKSMAALGNVGAKLNGLGRNLNSRLGNKINSSEAVQNARKNITDNRNAWMGEKYLKFRGDRNKQLLQEGKLSRAATRRMQRAYNAVDSGKNEQLGVRSAMGRHDILENGGYEAALANADLSEAQTAIKNYEAGIVNDGDLYNSTENLRNNLEELIRNGGDENEIAAYSNILAGKGNAGMEEVSKIYDEFMKDGNIDAKYSKGMTALSRNIMNMHGGAYKDKVRGTYEAAKVIASKQYSGGTHQSFERTAFTQKYGVEDIAKASNKELMRLANRFDSYNFSKSEQDHLRQLISQATDSNGKIRATIGGESMAQINKIAAKLGMEDRDGTGFKMINNEQTQDINNGGNNSGEMDFQQGNNAEPDFSYEEDTSTYD